MNSVLILKARQLIRRSACFLMLSITTTAWAEKPPLIKATDIGFYSVIQVAVTNDPWLEGNRLSQKSIEARADSSSTLPDPTVSLSMNNLPLDSFEFDQEGMTQLKIGFSQMIPRGDTLDIKYSKIQHLAESLPYERENRIASLYTQVGSVWLDIYNAQASIHLIRDNYALFEQLVGVAESSYSSAIGRTRQHDVIRAQLELVRLDDRLTKLHQHLDAGFKRLSEWVRLPSADYLSIRGSVDQIKLIDHLSDFSKMESQINDGIITHPLIKSLDKKINAQESTVDLAKQKYKPSYTINGSYGYREDMPNGTDRADLFSIGVKFDLPLFTGNKQDKEVNSEKLRLAKLAEDRTLLLRKLKSSLKTNEKKLSRLTERHELYVNELIPRMQQQAEASLTAYTNDDGDFAEVVRARIAVLNAQIELIGIEVDRAKVTLSINYLMSPRKVITAINATDAI
ncbi:MAG: TolC family protein [Pseudomonadales bacterium]|nr:TolC family protein [Pseudomonadales bacterium]